MFPFEAAVGRTDHRRPITERESAREVIKDFTESLKGCLLRASVQNGRAQLAIARGIWHGTGTTRFFCGGSLDIGETLAARASGSPLSAELPASALVPDTELNVFIAVGAVRAMGQLTATVATLEWR